MKKLFMGLCEQDKEEIKQVLAYQKKFKNFKKTIDKTNKRWYNKDIVRER